jgi:hypothetical protein
MHVWYVVNLMMKFYGGAPEELLHGRNWLDDCGEPKLPEIPYRDKDPLYLEDEVQIARNDRRALQNPWSPLGTAFDPFTPFSGPVSDHDKRLLYYCKSRYMHLTKQTLRNSQILRWSPRYMVQDRTRHIVQNATALILNLSLIQSPDSGLC